MRLITRGDLDGLGCAVLFKEHLGVEEVILAHPRDISQDLVEVREGDIIANLPYHPACSRWFDHRLLTVADHAPPNGFLGRHDAKSPSAARLVWKHCGSPARFEALVAGTDRLDGGLLDEEDILAPRGYVLLGYTLDPRSGLGSFRYYFQRCLEWVAERPIEEVLELPLVVNRVEQLREHAGAFQAALRQCSRVEGKIVVTDLRRFPYPPVGNRFLVHALYPETHVALRIHWGPGRKTVVAAAGHSVLDRSCRVNLGELMGRFGGGGHHRAAAATLPAETAEGALAEIIAALGGGKA
jgi:hypothetical protein